MHLSRAPIWRYRQHRDRNILHVRIRQRSIVAPQRASRPLPTYVHVSAKATRFQLLVMPGFLDVGCAN